MGTNEIKRHLPKIFTAKRCYGLGLMGDDLDILLQGLVQERP